MLAERVHLVVVELLVDVEHLGLIIVGGFIVLLGLCIWGLLLEGISMEASFCLFDGLQESVEYLLSVCDFLFFGINFIWTLHCNYKSLNKTKMDITKIIPK